MKNFIKDRSGFSLIELLISMAIMGAIGAVATVNILSFSNEKILLNQIERLETVLRTVQQQAVDEENASDWGVKIFSQVGSDDKYETFYGSSYDTGTVDDIHFLPSQIQFSRPTGGSAVEIVFTQGSGGTTANYFDIEIVSTGEGHRLSVSDQGSVTTITQGKGLVGYWKLDEETGSTAVDVSGFENDGTRVDAQKDQAGKMGTSYNFATSCTREVDIPRDDLDFTTGDFTIMMWVKQILQTADGRVFSAGVYQTSGYEIFVDNIIEARTYQSAANQNTTSATTLSTGTWYHIAVTRTGAVVKTFLNGADDTNSSGTHINPTTGGVNTVEIGKYKGSSAADCFDGYIDDVRAFNRVVSDNEITDIYNNTK